MEKGMIIDIADIVKIIRYYEKIQFKYEIKKKV
jgi:hypothetical protein